MRYVAELRYPGRWLDHEDHEWCLRVESRFHHLERFLAEAAISLNLFEERRVARGPEAYDHLAPYVHARAFMAALDDIGKWLAVLESDIGCLAARRRYSAAFPGMHVPAGGEYGLIGCELLRISETAVESPPHAGMLVLESRAGCWHALRFTAECPLEVEVSAESLFLARDCVQSAICSLRWRGPCRLVP